MSISRKETTVTTVFHRYVSRDGLTVRDLRKFLRQIDEAGIGEDVSVRHEHKLTHEGSSAFTGSLSAETREVRDVPIVAAARPQDPETAE